MGIDKLKADPGMQELVPGMSELFEQNKASETVDDLSEAVMTILTPLVLKDSIRISQVRSCLMRTFILPKDSMIAAGIQSSISLFNKELDQIPKDQEEQRHAQGDSAWWA